jgi:hypothetical protein
MNGRVFMPTPQHSERVLKPISRHNFLTILRGVGIISLSISRREIDGYKLPSTYTTTNFLGVLYTHSHVGVDIDRCNQNRRR